MTKDELKKKVKYFISLKKEGPNWDFKENYSDKNEDFLHDIICMANNLNNEESYLIYGVTADFKIKGLGKKISTNIQADKIDYMKKIEFVGDNRPNFLIESIYIL